MLKPTAAMLRLIEKEYYHGAGILKIVSVLIGQTYRKAEIL